MFTWFHGTQLAFVGLAVALIAERVWLLLWVLPVSDAALRFVLERVRAGDLASAHAWASQRARTVVAQLVLGDADGTDDGLDLEGLLSELTYRASVRLTALRVCATLASTLGLLGGILAIRRGWGDSQGLLALEQGLAERVAMGEALVTMALGVATSAVCFYALAMLRRALRDLVTQARSVVHALRVAGAELGENG